MGLKCVQEIPDATRACVQIVLPPGGVPDRPDEDEVETPSELELDDDLRLAMPWWWWWRPW